MAKLTPVCVDLETFWSQTHSLSKMNPIAYCTNQETELISIAYKFANDKPHCIVGEQDIKSWAKAVDWSDKLVYGHNLSGFDAMILRWRLGLRPAMWGCTLAMARPLHAITVGGSLAKLVAHYKLGVKDQTALMDTKGRHLKDFTPQEVAAMREYNKADVAQCAALFEILLPLTPKREMKLIDMTVRMLVEPRFRVNTEMLTKTLAEEQQRKETLLLDVAEALGFDRDEMNVAEKVRAEMASAPKFSAALERLGVEVPVKQSPSDPEKVIPALAKSDEAFLALQEHEDERVAAAARCRLDVKSTILESRIQSFLEVADCTGGRMPIAKNYYGAHTGRWSGCLVADTRVLCYEAYTSATVSKRIVDVLPDDLVWDGEAFVAHDGVAFSGFAEVIEWDGVQGTEDHVVFTDEEEISLREAMQRHLPIKTCSLPTKDDLGAARIYARHHKKFSTL